MWWYLNGLVVQGHAGRSTDPLSSRQTDPSSRSDHPPPPPLPAAVWAAVPPSPRPVIAAYTSVSALYTMRRWGRECVCARLVVDYWTVHAGKYNWVLCTDGARVAVRYWLSRFCRFVSQHWRSGPPWAHVTRTIRTQAVCSRLAGQGLTIGGGRTGGVASHYTSSSTLCAALANTARKQRDAMAYCGETSGSCHIAQISSMLDKKECAPQPATVDSTPSSH